MVYVGEFRVGKDKREEEPRPRSQRGENARRENVKGVRERERERDKERGRKGGSTQNKRGRETGSEWPASDKAR